MDEYFMRIVHLRQNLEKVSILVITLSSVIAAYH